MIQRVGVNGVMLLLWCACGKVMEVFRNDLVYGPVAMLVCGSCGEVVAAQDTVSSVAAAARMGINSKELASMFAQMEPLL